MKNCYLSILKTCSVTEYGRARQKAIWKWGLEFENLALVFLIWLYFPAHQNLPYFLPPGCHPPHPTLYQPHPPNPPTPWSPFLKDRMCEAATNHSLVILRYVLESAVREMLSAVRPHPDYYNCHGWLGVKKQTTSLLPQRGPDPVINSRTKFSAFLHFEVIKQTFYF